MNCPKCDVEMTDGRVQTRGTALGFLVVGLSRQHLWFESKPGDEQVVVPYGRGAAAAQCPHCGLVVIPKPANE